MLAYLIIITESKFNKQRIFFLDLTNSSGLSEGGVGGEALMKNLAGRPAGLFGDP